MPVTQGCLRLHPLTFIYSPPQLLEVHEVLCALEKKVETPHNSRIRPLSGADMNHTQFQQKIEDVSALECKLTMCVVRMCVLHMLRVCSLRS